MWHGGGGEKVRQQRSRPFVVLTYYEYAPRATAPAALPVKGRVLARLGWAGQTTSLFEQPPGYLVFTQLIKGYWS
jgi:hypothetical protein